MQGFFVFLTVLKVNLTNYKWLWQEKSVFLAILSDFDSTSPFWGLFWQFTISMDWLVSIGYISSFLTVLYHFGAFLTVYKWFWPNASGCEGGKKFLLAISSDFDITPLFWGYFLAVYKWFMAKIHFRIGFTSGICFTTSSTFWLRRTPLSYICLSNDSW